MNAIEAYRDPETYAESRYCAKRRNRRSQSLTYRRLAGSKIDTDTLHDNEIARYGAIILPMILTLDLKRRLTLPASLVPAQPGDHFEAEFDAEEDAVIFRRISKNVDWLSVLKGCPVKMDDLPPRRREFPKRLRP